MFDVWEFIRKIIVGKTAINYYRFVFGKLTPLIIKITGHKNNSYFVFEN